MAEDFYRIKKGLSIKTSTGQAQLFFGTKDPSTEGQSGGLGSLFMRSNNDVIGEVYWKSGTADTNWVKMVQGGGSFDVDTILTDDNGYHVVIDDNDFNVLVNE